MEQFHQFETNCLNKFLSKQKKIENKNRDKINTSKSVLIVQKNIRWFLMAIRSKNQLLLIPKWKAKQHIADLIKYWHTNIHQKKGIFTKKKIVALTGYIVCSDFQFPQSCIKKFLIAIFQNDDSPLSYISDRELSAILKYSISKSTMPDLNHYLLISQGRIKKKLMNQAAQFIPYLLMNTDQEDNHVIRQILKQYYVNNSNLVTKKLCKQTLQLLYFKALRILKQKKSPIYCNLLCDLLVELKDRHFRFIIESYGINQSFLSNFNELELQQFLQQKKQWIQLHKYIDNGINFEQMVQLVHLSYQNKNPKIAEFLYQFLQINFQYSVPIKLNFFFCLMNLIDSKVMLNLVYDVPLQYIIRIILKIINLQFTIFTDKQFLKQFKSQQGELSSVIKFKLLKIINSTLFISRPSRVLAGISYNTIILLENLYNKIFRTRILQTAIFQNLMMAKKFKAYVKIKSSRNDEITVFLKNFPFVFPLELRMNKFRQFVSDSRFYFKQQDNRNRKDFLRVVIRRGHEFKDTLKAFRGYNIKNRFEVQFINQLGLPQAGIDQNGLTKQMINRVLKCALNPEYGLFIQNHNKQLMPNPSKAESQEQGTVECYLFIGQLLGKALYENLTLGPKFSGAFLNVLVGKKNTFDDLSNIDADLYRSLKYIGDMREDAEELALNFQFKDQSRKKLVNLKPRGNQIQVNNENKFEYVQLLTQYKVNKSLQYQSRYIRKGLSQVIEQEWLFMFNYEQLNFLMSGSGIIDISNLKTYTVLRGYNTNDITVVNFWKVLNSFTEEQKSLLLAFVTSCPRPSFLGFKDLTPPFTIIKNTHTKLLPISHTCSNILQLPNYQSYDLIKTNLLLALNSNAGFQIA